jgi:hypothetical protein
MKLKQILEAKYYGHIDDYSEVEQYARHGGAYDRGRADSYYHRHRDPHYYDENRQRIEPEYDDHDYRAYMQGYDDNEKFGDHKLWEGLNEAKYVSSGAGQLVNRALEAVPRMRENGEQVFVSKFEDADGNRDPDIFLKTYKDLVDRFGKPEFKKTTSEGHAMPHWYIDSDIYLLLHHVGISVIIE